MAQLTGTAQAFHGDTSGIDSSRVAELGKRAWDASGNEYIYLQGTASTTAGDWVVYDESYHTTRLIANEVGPVAVAMAAVPADNFGWYQVYGKNEIARTDTVAADKSLYIDGTTGRADDAGVAGDLIIGAYSMSADSSNVSTVSLNYPHVSDDLGGSSATASGNDTEVQFNDGGAFGADPDLTFIKTTGVLTAVGYSVGTANLLPVSNDGAALGSTSLQFSDLFLASGGVINFDNGGMTATHSSEILTLGGGDVRVSSPGTATTSVATLAGTQTLTNKTISLTDNTLSGTTAEFNTALSDGSFATLDGIETLTNKTLTTPTIGDFSNATHTHVSNATGGALGTAAITSGVFGVARGGTGTAALTAYAVVAGGTTSTNPLQSVAGLGSSGQVLTSNGAGALPTWQNTASAGGGTTRQVTWLSVRDAVLPNTLFPQLNKASATNVVYETLDFNTTTSWECYYTVPITFTPINTAKLLVLWTAEAGTGTFILDADWRSLSDGEPIDSTANPSITNDTATDTLLVTGTLHSFDIPLTAGTSKIVSGDLLHINLSRDVSDTLSATARVVAIAYIAE